MSEPTPEERMAALAGPLADLCCIVAKAALRVAAGKARIALTREELSPGWTRWTLDLVPPAADQDLWADDPNSAALD